jgi:hypothetical protein
MPATVETTTTAGIQRTPLATRRSPAAESTATAVATTSAGTLATEMLAAVCAKSNLFKFRISYKL